MSESAKILLAIDGTNRVHKLWHVVRDAANVARQFVRDLGMLVEATAAARVVVAFDSPHCFRRKLDESYKLHRGPKEQGLRDALEQSLADASKGYPCFQVDGFEADDILASAAAECVRTYESPVDRTRCVIVSPDKDLRQCLRAGIVTIMLGWKGSGERFAAEYMREADLVEKYGITPAQWIDYQCLVGDTTDGIAGADSVGEKTALEILHAAGSIEGILANRWLCKLTERQWRGLKSLERRLEVVRQLVTLRTDVVIDEEVTYGRR